MVPIFISRRMACLHSEADRTVGIYRISFTPETLPDCSALPPAPSSVGEELAYGLPAG